MKKHIKRVLFFLFISSCPLIVTIALWMLTFGQAFTFVGAVTSGFYISITAVAILFASVVSITIDDDEIPL